MADFSQRLREPMVLALLVVAAIGWVAFFAMWFNSATQYGSQQETVAMLMTERDVAQAQLAEITATSGTLEELRGQASSSQAKLDATTQALETARADLSSRNDELVALDLQLETKQAVAEQLDTQVATATRAVSDLDASRQQLESEINQAQSQLTDIGARVEEARALEATVTTNVAQYTKEAAASAASLSRTQTQLQDTQEKLTAAQTQMADLAGQTEAAQSALAQLQQQTADLERRRDQLLGELQSYQSQRDELQPQVEQLTSTLADRSQELANVEAQLGESVASSDAASTLGQFIVSGEGSAQGLTLTLNEDASFTMTSRSGRSVSGSYILADQELRLTDANGDLGNASFPMACSISRTPLGFTVGSTNGCAISGLTFDQNK